VITSFCLLYQPALSAMMLDSVPPERRGLGLAMMSILPELLGLPAPLLALYLVSTYGLVRGMRIAYALTATAGLVVALIRLLFLEETLAVPRARDGGSLRESYREAFCFTVGELKPILPLLVLRNLSMGVNAFVQVYVIWSLGLSLTEWGEAYFLANILWILSLLPAGALTDLVGRKRTLSTGFIFISSAMAGFLLLGPRPPLWAVVVLLLATWSGGALAQNAMAALQADMIPRPLRGRVAAILALTGGISAASSSLLCGYLYEAVGPEAPFLLCLYLSLAALDLCLVGLREPPPGERHR